MGSTWSARVVRGDDDDDLEDGGVVAPRRTITIPLMLMDHGAPPPPPAPKLGRLFVDDGPAEKAYLDYKRNLSQAYLQKPKVIETIKPFDATLPRVGPVRVSDQSVRDSRAVCERAWCAYVDRLSNAWREQTP